MKKTILALSLVAALAACNGGAANNSAGAPANAANSSAGLPTPPERPAQPTAQQTAMPPGLDCIRNRLSPEERRGVAAVALEQGEREDPRLQTLIQAGEACGDELGWSEQKTQLATQFSAAAAGGAAIREMLASRNVRIEELDQTIITDPDLMAAATAGDLGNSQAGRNFAIRHVATIERILGGQGDREVGVRIGNYIAFRAIAEAAALQFARAQ